MSQRMFSRSCLVDISFHHCTSLLQHSLLRQRDRRTEDLLLMCITNRTSYRGICCMCKSQDWNCFSWLWRANETVFQFRTVTDPAICYCFQVPCVLLYFSSILQYEATHLFDNNARFCFCLTLLHWPGFTATNETISDKSCMYMLEMGRYLFLKIDTISIFLNR